jgi:CRP-like cAMP-binding protein
MAPLRDVRFRTPFCISLRAPDSETETAMSVQRSSLALRHIALLQGLPDERLDRLAQDCDWRSVAAGMPVLLRSEAKTDVHLLVSGRMRVTTYSAQGKQVTFRDATAGEHFGDIAAIDGKPRSADVVTLTPCVLASLTRDRFLQLLREEPPVAEHVMRGLAALVRQLSERVLDLSTLAVQHRVDIELLRLAHDTGVIDNQARLEPAPTHADIANQISTSREQVTREINALNRAGMLRKEGRALIVVDVARLERVVAEAPRA